MSMVGPERKSHGDSKRRIEARIGSRAAVGGGPRDGDGERQHDDTEEGNVIRGAIATAELADRNGARRAEHVLPDPGRDPVLGGEIGPRDPRRVRHDHVDRGQRKKYEVGEREAEEDELAERPPHGFARCSVRCDRFLHPRSLPLYA
jgi:hypothetical protein